MDNWSKEDVRHWLKIKGFSSSDIQKICDTHQVDGQALVMLNETDLKEMGFSVMGVIKRLSAAINDLRRDFHSSRIQSSSLSYTDLIDIEDRSPKSPSIHSCDFKPEIGKAVIAFIYLFLVCGITSVVMVVAHDRVPDGTDYPPLPDLILENVPYISWAFEGAEICGILLMTTWALIIAMHKHRFILFRRQCALAGTVFLLRCITMLITTLSIPGRHIDCASTRPTNEFWSKVERGIRIWSGFGMQLQGVRTCGDYMFSGHTAALTLLAHFVCEYSPRRWYTLHNFANLLNMFGVFFILAGHEHYSIDVFVAYYISSRVFLYYHSMANSRVLMQPDDLDRTRTFFPLFSYFESECHGVVPNEYEWPWISWKVYRASRLNSSQDLLQNGSLPCSPIRKSSPRRHRTRSSMAFAMSSQVQKHD